MTKRATVLAFACLLAASSVAAQETGRTLYWRSLDVVARVEADGRLRVRERHAMVFNGAWNGGSRTFNIRTGQRHEFYSISRIDAAGTAHRLTAGELDQVDRFAWANSNELRWRSRLPTDPAFVNQQIVYEIDYALVNVLIPTSTGYTLDHDFAFPNRPGIIEQFTLQLELDPMWQSTTSTPLRRQRANLWPGVGVVVQLPLSYVGAGTPSGVEHGVSVSLRLLLAFILLGGFAWLLRAFLQDEIALGRFQPLKPVHEIDAEWLGAHIFNLPPEVVGAAWDTKTGAPEVAAMIARMVQEGKLGSHVESHKWKQILHLELKVARETLSADERKLAGKLFRDDETKTDTETIRKRYRKSGFDPAYVIRGGIEKQIRALLPGDYKTPRNALPIVIVALMVAVAAVAALVSALGTPLPMAGMIVLAAGLAAFGPATLYRTSVVGLRRRASHILLLLLIAAAPVLAVVLGVFEVGGPFLITDLLGAVHPGVALFVNLIAVFLGLAFLVLRAARTREAPERLERRRTLAAAREYFAQELQKKQPALEDEWFPYLMAFGLGSHVDKWFRAFGAAAGEPAVFATSSAAAAAASSTGWSGGGPLFGGGGGFAGGGAGRSWAAVAQTFSSGVSAASSGSGSGGGGGGGGGSSGGGGGGGW